MRPRVMLATVGILLAADQAAHCEPAPADLGHYVHFASGLHYTTPGGSAGDEPEGYFLDVPEHNRVEAEWHRLQDVETRLTAENASLTKSLAGWQPGFYTLLMVAVSGLVLGVYVGRKL